GASARRRGEDMDIEGKTALVSGGGSGIGRATVVMLANAGARVVAADIDEKGGAETIEMATKAGGKASFRRCDVTRPDDLAATIAFAFDQYGSLDIVYNNAGIGGEELFTDEAGLWKRVVDINLTAV